MSECKDKGLWCVLDEIAAERGRQEAKWGEQNHPSLCQVLLRRVGGCSADRMAEEYEIPTESRAKQLIDTAVDRGECTYAHILLEEVCEAVACLDDERRIREELVQVAAVAVAWIQCIDRRIERHLGIEQTEGEK